MGAVFRAPGDYPAGKPHSEAFSFQVATDDQAETDRAAAKRVFEAMMGMSRIDIAAIEAAWRNS